MVIIARAKKKKRKWIDLTKVTSELKILFPTFCLLVGGGWNITPYKWVDRWPPKLENPMTLLIAL